MRKFWKFLKRLFKKKLKPRNIEERELVANGYIQASDYMCIKENKKPHQ